MDGNVSWSQPRKTFKIRKGAANGKPPPSADLHTPQSASPQPSSTGGVKRRNPFSNVANVSAEEEEVKRRRLSDNYFHANSPKFSRPSFNHQLQSSLTQNHHNQKEDNNEVANSEELQQQNVQFASLSELPVDWSLKTQVTFLSLTPWKWSQHLSSVQVASSVTSSVRCLEISKGNHCLDTSATSQFYSNCYYWQFPSLPGVQLYPRYRQSRLEKIPLGAEMHRAANSEWIHSLQSVYQLVKAGQCPYFYVCTQLFTCLFRAPGMAGSQQILALLTPTTSGIRAALAREEVEFTMPLRRKDTSAENEAEEGEAGECCASVVEERGGATDILESLGIEADSLPGFSTNTTTIKSTAQSKVVLDGRSDSLVFIEGVECQSLLNYLINAKLSSVHELPPTILSPSAFPGATLKCLKVKEHVVGGKAGQPKGYQIDVTGPILPHTLQGLALLSSQHSEDFKVRTRTQEDTISFSAFNLPEDSQAQAAFASANLNDCGLLGNLLTRLAKVQNNSQEKVLRHLHIKKHAYKILDDLDKDV